MCFKVPLYFRLFKFRHIKVYSKVNKYPLQNMFLLHLQTGYLVLFVWKSASDSFMTVKQTCIVSKSTDHLKRTELQSHFKSSNIKSNLQFCQLLHRMSHERLFKMRKMFTFIPNIFMGHSEILLSSLHLLVSFRCTITRFITSCPNKSGPGKPVLDILVQQTVHRWQWCSGLPHHSSYCICRWDHDSLLSTHCSG